MPLIDALPDPARAAARAGSRAASRAVTRAGGLALGAAARTAGLVRPTARPLHPRGEVVAGRLERRGLPSPTGVAWLDEAGEDDVLVRRSRAVGLPGWMPDIHGLALRVPLGDTAYGDLLLASTGSGALGRFVLLASRDPGTHPLTTLLPYRSPAGPLLIGARVVDADAPDRLELACAVGTGEWQPFGSLVLAPTGRDPLLSFDPVRHRIPGLEQYAWVERLREPAYAEARRSR